MVAGLAGGGYYLYQRGEKSAAEAAQRRDEQRQAQFLQCLRSTKTKKRIPQTQPELDRVLQRCIATCRDNDFWTAEQRRLTGPALDKRRSLVCGIATINLLHFRELTYVKADPWDLYKVSCKYGGVFPSKCKEQYFELELKPTAKTQDSDDELLNLDAIRPKIVGTQ